MNEYYFKQPKRPGLHHLPGLVKHPKIKCCGKYPVLVESSSKGFPKSMCTLCGRLSTLSRVEFLQNFNGYISCCKCNSKMNAKIVLGKYFFQCDQCKSEVAFVDILPDITDIKLQPMSELNHRSKEVISLCVNCSKYGSELCPGPSITTGSYDRSYYSCGSFRPEYKIEDRY